MKKFLIPVLLGAVFSQLANAQTNNSVTSINTQTFNPSTSNRFVLLEDAFRTEWPKKNKTYFGLNYNYVREPFVSIYASGPDEGKKANTLIESIQTADLMVGFKISSRFGLFFGMPIHMITYPVGSDLLTPSAQLTGASSTTIGDIKILGKIRLTDDDNSLHFALLPEIHLPTGNTQNFVSDASAYLGLRGVIEREFKKFTLTATAGFAAASNASYQPSASTQIIDLTKRFLFGVGGYTSFSDKWGMSVEFDSQSMIPFNNSAFPNELYAGLRYAATESSVLTFGGALGKLGGVAGQSYRLIAGLRINLYDMEETEQEPAIPAAPAPAAKPRVVFKPKQIEISEPIKFMENSDVLTPEGKKLLDEVAQVIKKNLSSISRIQLNGHTNNNGGENRNLLLSLNRSRAVKKYLISKGIASNIFETRGFGQAIPKVQNSDPKAVEFNRRVEFTVIQ